MLHSANAHSANARLKCDSPVAAAAEAKAESDAGSFKSRAGIETGMESDKVRTNNNKAL